MVERQKKRIGEILIEEGILSKENVEEALAQQKQQGGLIGQILLRMGYLTEDQLVSVLCKQLDVPFMPLASYSVDLEAARRLDETFCRRYLLLAFDQDDRHIFLAVADPLHDSAIAEVEKKTGLKPQVFAAIPTDISRTLDLAFNTTGPKNKK